MKPKKNLPPELQKFNGELADRISQNSFVIWIAENPKILLYLCLALLAFFLIIIRWSGGNWFKSESDFLRAEADFSQLKQPPLEGKSDDQARLLTNLRGIIEAHPELHAKYDAEIAQILIAQGRFSNVGTSLAKSLENSKNSEKSLHLYQQFSNTTFLIEEGQFEQALQQALTLKQDLIGNAQEAQNKSSPLKYGNILFAYNLLRIAFLQQQLNDKKGELATWQEWKQFSYSNSTDSQIFKEINAQLEENDISLQDYIRFREEKLSS